jgi:hypothetical protein
MPAYDPRLFSPPAPVATVIVRHQESGVKVTDVPMLLDLGGRRDPDPANVGGVAWAVSGGRAARRAG